MKLAIINLTAGGISGGHRNYLYSMLPRLAASDTIEKILCVSPASFKAEEWLEPSPKVTLALCKPFSLFRPAPDKELKVSLDAFRPDVIFVSMERHVNYPGVPIVTMVHNMAPLVSIPTVSGIVEKVKSLARRFETGVAVRRPSALIAPTTFVRDVLVESLGVERGKISIIPFGQDPLPSPKSPSDKTRSLLKNGFVFTAGTFEIYRGIEDLLQAFADIKGRFPGLKLVLAGGARPATYAYRSKMGTLADTLGISRDVVWLGHVSQGELSWFYRNCSAFALTSRVESFCFVALEALAHGCNCVATDSPCLPEVLTDASLYYKAGDVKGLGNCLIQVLSQDPAAMEKASARAVNRAAEFSWDKAAESTIDLLKKVSSLPLPDNGM